MIAAAAPGLRWQTAVAVVLAYALMLQGVFVSAASASTGLTTYVCGATAGARDAHPGVPDQSRRDHATCALCGLGHCGMALPAGTSQPQALSCFVAPDIRAIGRGPALHARRAIAARPRGPPNQG